MEEAASLRRAAPCWSLSGDQQLLDALQNLHQRIISKCEETNTRLSNMASALTHASVALHNVNNKFMALSNSQFIESRVYDDDVEVKADTVPAKDPPQVAAGSDLEILKSSLIQLEQMHETVTILNDSDTDSEDEDQLARVVLKPKDLYTNRPLPHIIGSYAWKTKWHAGLLPDDSDSDSTTSKPDREPEQYSDSEPDSTGNIQTDRQRDTTVSSSASSLAPSPPPPPAPAPPPPPAPAPAAVALDLARRPGLGVPGRAAAAAPAAPAAPAGTPKMPETEEEFTPPKPAVRKMYRPEQPSAGAIFSDEPPPLDTASTSSNDDIFAELHRGQHRDQHWGQHWHQPVDLFVTKQAPDDLFSNDDDDGDIFSDFAEINKPTQNPALSTKPKSTLFDDEPEPDLFAEKPKLEGSVKSEDNDRVKKPIGGISLFGAKNSESIGAAILQRNQTLSSTSGNESDDNKPKQQTIIKKDNSQISKTTKDKKEPLQTSKLEISRDIFDDLFAKSEILQKKEAIEKQKVPDIKENVLDKKVDLFNDNLFDDIDDIFSSNIVKSKQSKEGNANKTLFDENDDLFADIAVTKTSFTEEIKNNLDKPNTKSIFDSDDDLFTDKTVAQAEQKEVYLAKTSVTKVNLKDTSLFDSDDDDDNIFSTKSKTDSKKKRENNQYTNDHKDMLKEDLDNDLFTNLTQKVTSETQTQGKISSEIKPSMSSHLANDSELFTSTSKNILDCNDSFKKDNEKSQGAISPLKDSEKAPIGNKSSEDEVLKTQHDAENSTKGTAMFSKTNYVQKNNDDIFTKDIVQDFEDTIDTKECENSVINHSKSKQLKVDDTFSEIMDEDDGDIFSNDKDKPQLKDTSKLNIENTSETQDILNDEYENDLFKTKNTGTDIIKAVTTDKMKPTISQKPISETPNTAETVLCSKTNSKQETTVNTESNIKTEINKNTTRNKTNLYENISNLTEKGKPDNMKDVDRNKNLTVVDNVLPEENMSHPDTPPILETHKNTFDDIFNEASKRERDLFSDIFNDQPPIFEKPKEPKKSQNVNALFDDDSDDEALFFKKNDVILHDHPEEFSPDISGDRFDIFHDEPPAIDIVQETIKNVSEQDSGIIFKPKVVEANTTNINENVFDSRQHIIVKGDNDKSKNNINDLESVFNDELHIIPAELKIQKTDEMKPNVDKTDGVPNEPKRIGKLRPMNFNINVNTLLPGASPKKVQKIEQTDEQTIPTKNNEDLQINEVSEQDGTKLVKSVSFESEPDSTILDNKLSKERVKIQVKRRPSTRRARREAVKKSGIDFGEDSTDNSNSIDDHVKESKIEAEKENDVIVSEKMDVSEQDNLPDGDGKSMTASRNTVISKDVAISEETDTSKGLKTEENLFSKGNTLENVTSSPIRDVKSKVVYILNDEDIFNSNPQVVSNMDAEVTKVDSVKVTKPTNVTLANLDNATIAELNVVTKSQPEATKTKQILNIVNDEDDEDIFKSMVTKSEPKTNIQPIKPSSKKIVTVLNSDSDDDIFKDFTNVKKKESTLKNESTATKLPKPVQKAIFDDLSDEDNELFNKNKKEFKTSNNKIFDSDSDEELFGKKKDKKREVKENKIEVKGSLFGDDDNDELFSSKEKKNAVSKPSSTMRSKSPTSTKPVFEDPLSLFENNDC